MVGARPRDGLGMRGSSSDGTVRAHRFSTASRCPTSEALECRLRPAGDLGTRVSGRRGAAQGLRADVRQVGGSNSHTRNDVPFLLAGGPIRKGQFLKFDKRPHNDLLLSICHALGLERSTFGDPRFNTGPISEILL